MNDIGYVYILANSSMPGVAKIGKTIRSASERAQELSNVTGLPTPFIVVYEQLFEDCSAAEKFVHTVLGNKGFRVSDNREFFNAPINEIVRAVSLAPGAITDRELVTGARSLSVGGTPANHDPDDLDELKSLNLNRWQAIFDNAEDSYYGHGDKLQDFIEAFRLYGQAAKLGCLGAYAKIGYMYEYGEGVLLDTEQAIKYYKEGARMGVPYCYWRMGRLFSREKNCLNAEKSFLMFMKKLEASRSDESGLPFYDWDMIDTECCTMLLMQMHGVAFPNSLNKLIDARTPELIVNLPLLDVPLSRSFMRPSIAVPRASFSQTALD